MEEVSSINQIMPKKRVKQVRGKEAMMFSRVKRRLLKHVWFLRIALAGGILAILLLIIFGAGLVLSNLEFSRYTSFIKNFIFTPSNKVQSFSGRTNILLMGKGGSGHEAPDLTDTMMLISVSHTKDDLVIVSLPRDIWMENLRAKLNSAYYWGNKKAPGGGLVLAKSAVEEIIGEPVHYAMVVDFSGLKKVIDVLGGVQVDVANSFVDEKYPIAGNEADLCGGDREFRCRYQTVRFDQGLQTMDGDTALKFVRSRNAQGDEGTDFARAARQQKVIDAIQKKILSADVLLSPSKIKELVSLYAEVVETDINEDASAVLARRIWETRKLRQSYVLGEEFLVNPPILPKYDNLYVFVPKSSDWSQVHQWITDLLKKD